MSESRNVVYWRKDKRRWMYQNAVPFELRANFGGRMFGGKGEPFERVYLKTAPRENTLAASRIAADEAAPYLTRDTAVVAKLLSMTVDERAKVDVPALAAFCPLKVAPLLLTKAWNVNGTDYPARTYSQEQVEFAEFKAAQENARNAVALRAAADIVIPLRAVPSAEFCLARFDDAGKLKESGLLAAYLAMKGKGWRGAANEHHQDGLRRALKRAADKFGDIDFRELDADMAGEYRDHLETLGKTYDWRERELQFMHRLYAGAIDQRKYKGANPFDNLKPSGSAADDNLRGKGKFTPRQLRAILERSAAAQFGEERHTAAHFALLLVTYTGFAPNEALLIQRGDVRKDDETGIAYIDLDQRDCVTKQQHPLKSLKNTESRPRLIPLHPALIAAGFFEWATNGEPQNFVFDVFAWNKSKYRRGWFDQNFMPVLLSDMEAVGISVIEIEKGGKKQRVAVNKRGDVLAFYSVRHLMHDLIDNADMTLKRQQVLTGHASQEDHDNYAGGANLVKLADDIAKLDPLKEVKLKV